MQPYYIPAVCIRSYRIKCKLQGACAEKTDNNDNLFYDVFAYAGLLFAIISCGWTSEEDGSEQNIESIIISVWFISSGSLIYNTAGM